MVRSTVFMCFFEENYFIFSLCAMFLDFWDPLFPWFILILEFISVFKLLFTSKAKVSDRKHQLDRFVTIYFCFYQEVGNRFRNKHLQLSLMDIWFTSFHFFVQIADDKSSTPYWQTFQGSCCYFSSWRKSAEVTEHYYFIVRDIIAVFELLGVVIILNFRAINVNL